MDSKPIYKTAAELGIEQWEHDGLVALIRPLSRGELNLNMKVFDTCDTVHCIGGWVHFFAKRSLHLSSGLQGGKCEKLCALYHPSYTSHGGVSYESAGWRATAPQAALAIINFLTLGDSCWDAVMRGDA